MYRNILTKEQVELLPMLKHFSKQFYLVGGTAVALQIGHRRSIDFDLFCQKNLRRKSLKNNIAKSGYEVDTIIHESVDELTLSINSVKTTFFSYPFDIPREVKFEDIINMPTLLDLAAMKAYALGMRAKWKDYVDLYFVMKDHVPFEDISIRAKELFKGMFNPKLFRQQICYFDDVNYSEKVVYMDDPVQNDDIKSYLAEAALQPF